MSSASPSLGSTFNAHGIRKMLDFNGKSDSKTGLLGLPVLARPEGFTEMQSDCIRTSESLVQEALSSPGPGGRSRIVSRVFDDLSDELCRVADLAEFVRLSHPDSRYRDAAEEACIQVSNQVERLNTHKGLYEALKNVSLENADAFPQSPVDKHVSKLFLLDFQQCGIHLDERSREKVVQLNDEILQLGQVFASNAFTPTVLPKSKVPAHIRPVLPSSDNNIVLSRN